MTSGHLSAENIEIHYICKIHNRQLVAAMCCYQSVKETRTFNQKLTPNQKFARPSSQFQRYMTFVAMQFVLMLTCRVDVPSAAGILVNAEGLAILTVVKVGFLVTARAGSGIVIAKLGRRSLLHCILMIF